MLARGATFKMGTTGVTPMNKNWLDQLLIRGWGIKVAYDTYTQKRVLRVLSGALMVLLPAELLVMLTFALTQARWLIGANFIGREVLALMIAGIFEIDGLHIRPQRRLGRWPMIWHTVAEILLQTVVIVVVVLINGLVLGFFRLDRLADGPWEIIWPLILGAVVANVTGLWTVFKAAG